MMDTRPPPPNGAPPPYAFVTRAYRRNLRPIVVSLAFLGGIWTLFSGIGFFRNVSIYNNTDASKLALFSIILGALYMGVFVIELFGIVAAMQQKIPLVRAFAYLSLLVVAIVATTGLIDIVVHFTLKDEIINTCQSLSMDGTVYYAGIFGPINGDSSDDPLGWCLHYWNRDSWSDIVAFLLITFLAAFFAGVAFAYLRQVLDPASPANALRGPAQHRMGAFPSHYSPPYNPNIGPMYGSSYPAPQGPPPNQEDAFVPPYEGKPPGYVQGDMYKGDTGYGKGDANWTGGHFDDDGPSSERDVASRPAAGPFR